MSAVPKQINANLETALELAATGVRVCGLQPDTKIPYGGTRTTPCGTSKTATTDEEAIRAFWTQFPKAVPAAVGGSEIEIDGQTFYLSFLDIDPANKKKQTVEQNRAASDVIAGAIEKQYPGVTKFEMRESRSGGRHYWLLSESPLRTRQLGVIHPEAELRGVGNYVVCWPGVREADAQDGSEVPQAFVDLIGAPRAKTELSHVALKDDEWAVGKAGEELERWRAKGSVPEGEGVGRDGSLYRFSAQLGDFRITQATALAFAHTFNNELCDPPLDEDIVQQKVYSGYKYRQTALGSASPEGMFEPIAPDAQQPAKPRPNKLRTPADFSPRDILATNYLVKGWIDQRSEAIVFGMWNVGKTFAVLDLAAHIAIGREWFGNRVKQTGVIYLGYEGHGKLPVRVEALRRKYPGLDAAPFAWWPMRHAMTTVKGHTEVEDARKAFHERFGAAPGLVIVDTLRSAVGGSDSDADKVEALRAEIRALIEAGSAVLLITHVGHGDKSRARGDSGIPAAADADLRVEATEDGGIRITALKQRDSAKGVVTARLAIVELGVDADGDVVTTCVVELAEGAAAVKAEAPVGAKDGRPGGVAGKALAVLEDLRPGNEPVGHEEWREACRRIYPESFGKPNAFSDAKYSLLHRLRLLEVDAHGAIRRRGGLFEDVPQGVPTT